MNYIPKAKIETGLFTNGQEYLLDGRDYVGPYYILYTGKAYSGLNQFDTASQLLEKYTPNSPTNVVTVTSHNTVLPFERDLEGSVYASITPTDKAELLAPAQYYPQPTDDEKQVGEMTRYFLKRVNDSRIIEVSVQTYNDILNQDNRYAWPLWIPVKLSWVIKGSEEEVASVNRKNVYYTEQKNKIKGLAQSLRFNFTQFLM
jgi:hypothetical protein